MSTTPFRHTSHGTCGLDPAASPRRPWWDDGRLIPAEPGTERHPYYVDDHVTLYHGDCLQITDWLNAEILVTDPPYGRAWQSGSGLKNGNGHGLGSKAHGGIVGDEDTSTRDAVLALWGSRLAAVFGDPLIPQPTGATQALVYAKPEDAGIRGARAGYRRDIEMIYLVGDWPVAIGGRTSVLYTSALVAGPRGLATRYGHPHAKPVDLLVNLLTDLGPGVVADPCAGGGSILAAASIVGRKSIGVEIEERNCELIAKRLAQGSLDFGGVA